MPDDDDRPSDASSAADASWADAVVPDDISELVADIESYHRELRRSRRAAWRHRVMARPGVLPLSIATIAVVLAGLVATLLTALAPSQPTQGLAPRPVATDSSAAVGAIGGLLPRVGLLDDGRPVGSISLRPSVVALVPEGCHCTSLLSRLAGQAYEVDYPFDVVAPGTTDAGALANAIPDGKPHVLLDPAYPSKVAASLYHRISGAAGLTLVLVRTNAVIYDIVSNVHSVTSQVSADLVKMTNG